MLAEALAPGQLSRRDAALVSAVSNLAGLLSLIPAGIGAYDGSVEAAWPASIHLSVNTAKTHIRAG